MIVLTFDTTMSACSASVHKNGVEVSKFYKKIVHGQSELILPAIETILRSANISYLNIDKIGLTLGPGSFTGIRVGVATAKALSLANHIECIGYSTTSILAREAYLKCNKKQKPIAVVIDARREEIYFQRFNANALPIEDPACLLPKEAARMIKSEDYYLIGDTISKIVPFLEAKHQFYETNSPNMDVLAETIYSDININKEIKPIYVRPPDVKTK